MVASSGSASGLGGLGTATACAIIYSLDSRFLGRDATLHVSVTKGITESLSALYSTTQPVAVNLRWAHKTPDHPIEGLGAY
jgi:hypothetical protein